METRENERQSEQRAGTVDAGSGEQRTGSDAGSGAGTVDAGRGAEAIPEVGAGAPKKRGRGRPTGSTKKAGAGSSKKRAGSGTEAGAGAEAGAVKKARTSRLAIAPGTLAKNIQFGHAAAALALNMPALQLDKAEAEQLAEAFTELANEYDVAVSPRTVAWIKLAAAGGAIYGPRVASIVLAKKIQKQQRPREPVQSATAAGAPAMDFSAANGAATH